MRGLFVAIESLDGVGKTTLVEGLAREMGGEVLATPGTAIKPLSPTILAALGNDQPARCLFYASTVLAQGRTARRVADTGGVVVMDRYWLSTIAYARARGVTVDVGGIEAVVPVPDLTLLLTLDEAERVRRLQRRGDMTAADAETLDPEFRSVVLREMRADRGRLTPVEVDVTGADELEAVARVLAALRRAGR